MNRDTHRLVRTWRVLRWVLAAAAVPAVLWACNSHPLEQPKPSPEAQSDLLYEVNPIRKLDLIFVVDNSVSMEEEQANLRKNFPAFMQRLEAIPGGLPDTRIAVLSTNFGAGSSHPAAECDKYGDRAVFQVKAGCGLDPNVARWLTVGGGVTPNFQGTLPNVFGCLANLGTTGCGYEHQLQSLRAAFAKNVAPENVGFLRDDAYLGIVILSDEDDCSADPQAEFFRDQIPGQAGSLRCALRGHVCNGQPVPATNGFTSALADCKPAEHQNSADDLKQKLINISTFVQEIKALKGFRGDKILVSGVIGIPKPGEATQYGIIQRLNSTTMMQELDLNPVCTDPVGGRAAPGIRLKSFIESFENHSLHTICQSDLTDTMTEIGNKLAGILTNTCINGTIFDVKPDEAGVQADCQVADRLEVPNSNPRRYTDTPIPQCGPGGSVNGQPCWQLKEDPSCGSRFRTVVLPEGRVPAPGTLQSIQCLTCTPDSTDVRCMR